MISEQQRELLRSLCSYAGCGLVQMIKKATRPREEWTDDINWWEEALTMSQENFDKTIKEIAKMIIEEESKHGR